MNKKICLTSLIAMGFVAPAMAITDSSSFPDASQGEYMQEDTRYINAATSTNMDGVYEGEVNANAQYENIVYQIARGKYLPANSDTPVDCDQNGYYCAGDSNGVNYSESGSQGLTQCPTGYNNSNTGASSEDECYRQCSGNVTIEHATGVTGNDYYGNGTDTCEPTGCVNGWHKKDGLNLQTAIGNTAGENSAYVNTSGIFREMNYDGQGAKGQAYYGITENDTWAVDYGTNGMLYGSARCSNVSGTGAGIGPYNPANSASDITTHTTAELGAEGGRYCYCNITGYTPSGGTLQSLSSPWVFYNGSYYGDCDLSSCAGNCEYSLVYTNDSDYLMFRSALFGSVTPTLASCEANTITINWNGTTQEAINANNAGVATYGGDVRTPQSATPVPGKRFTGWRFSAPTPTSVDPEPGNN